MMTKQLPGAPAGMAADMRENVTTLLPGDGIGDQLSIHVGQAGSSYDLMLAISRQGQVLAWYPLSLDEARYINAHFTRAIAMKVSLLAGGGTA